MESGPSQQAGPSSERTPLINKPSHFSVPARVRRRLYVSHFLSTWNSRVFEFGAVMYLANIFPGTLLPMSAYAFARGLSAIVLAPFVGQYIDSGDRLQVVRVSIVGQRFAVAASTVIFYILSIRLPLGEAGEIGMLVLLALFACIEVSCSIMNMVSIEKDWVVVVAADDQAALRNMNAQMRRIDLFCKLFGPLFIALVDSVSTEVAIITNFALNICSVTVEYHAIARVFREVPELQQSKAQRADRTEHLSGPEQSPPRATSTIRKFCQNFAFYFGHRSFLPSFAGSLLYLTVLSFGGQMVTYLLSIGYTSLDISLARTASVLCELMATWVAPWLMSMIGPVRAGLWMGSWQVSMLAAGAAVFLSFIDQPSISASGLVGGVILSRVGLRGFDLCVQIIVQEEVEGDNRGAFSTVEAAIQNAFELLSYTLTIVFSRPEDFMWPALISVGSVASAVSTYAAFVHARRGHLLHLDTVMDCFPQLGRLGWGGRETVIDRIAADNTM